MYKDIDLIIGIAIGALFLYSLLHFRISSILEKNGYKANWFFNADKNTSRMFELARNTKKKNTRRKYYLLGITYMIGPLIIFIGVIMASYFFI